MIGSGRFSVTLDRDFEGVIAACADREETWINASIEAAMHELHAQGFAHSVEAWRDGELAGGLYGVRLGRAFFGESMFSREPNASKVALAWLIARLRVGGFTLLDCQFMTSHLASLGAIDVSRKYYSAALAVAVGGDGGASAGSAGLDGLAAADPPDFGTLDRLLEPVGGAGAAGPAGKVIVQLLGQMS